MSFFHLQNIPSKSFAILKIVLGLFIIVVSAGKWRVLFIIDTPSCLRQICLDYGQVVQAHGTSSYWSSLRTFRHTNFRPYKSNTLWTLIKEDSSY